MTDAPPSASRVRTVTARAARIVPRHASRVDTTGRVRPNSAMSSTHRDLIARLGIRYPILQAPMAGGPTTPALVAAVSQAGGLGNLGGAYLTPEALREAIRAVRDLTDRPFGVNLFAHLPSEPADPAHTADLDRALAARRKSLGLPMPAAERGAAQADQVHDQIQVIADERVPVFSYTFGILDASDAAATGTAVLGTATSVAEARALAEAGVDAVIAQGAEAGGHRGSFLTPFAEAQVGTIALVPQVVDAVDVPVIAAGGIGDGRGVAAALALGAQAAALGTAFLRCPESGAPQTSKRALGQACDTSTIVTDRFTGRPARGLRNTLLADLEAAGVPPAPFPAQGALIADLRAEALRRDEPELMVIWSGQAAALSRPEPAGEVVRRLAAEADLDA